MSNYYIMSNQTKEGEQQPQYFVNPYPTGPVPSAPPVMIEQNNIQSTINSNYPANNPNPPSTYQTVITYADYENPRRIHHHGPQRQRVIYVDELDYQRRKEQEQRKKKGFWKGMAALFCCLFCCCPVPC